MTVWSLLLFFLCSVGQPRELTALARLWFILLESSAFFPPLIVKTHFLINSADLFNLAGV